MIQYLVYMLVQAPSSITMKTGSGLHFTQLVGFTWTSS